MTRRLPALLALLPLVSVFADAIKLKSGEVIEGRIVESDANSVVIEVQFSPTITEQRRVARTELDVAVVATPDEKEFKRLEALPIPATALTTRPYDELLDKQLRPFLKKFPKSDRLPDVRERIKSLEADLARLRKGEVKVAGKWYSADAYAAEKYQLEAAAVFAGMERDMQAQSYVGALNQFDVLRASFPGSVAFADAIPLGAKALKQFGHQLALATRNLPQVRAQRQAVIDRTPVEQRPNIERALAAEEAQVAAVAERAKAAKQRFFPVVGFDEKGLKALTEAHRQATAEQAKFDATQMRNGAALVRQAQRELSEREYAGARTTVDQLKRAWPTYEGLARLEKQVADGEAAREAGSKVGAATAGATPPAPTPAPTPVPAAAP